MPKIVKELTEAEFGMIVCQALFRLHFNNVIILTYKVLIKKMVEINPGLIVSKYDTVIIVE